ncbi:MAG: FtsQ-type POTRA domain-containing protein [Gammaproteobacteria bacterium]|nr:FtsQ-type POTRA domain-containing protein [Gammaproteobacteria bacterium]
MLNRMLLFVVGAAAVIGAYGLWLLLDVPVSKLVISGDLTQIEQANVRAALTSGSLGGILTADLKLLESKLDGMHWARNVTVRRQWPNIILVSLTREMPMARWGKDQYISAGGHLLTLPDQYFDIPSFDVAISSPHRAMEVFRLLDQIASREGLNINSLKQDDQGGWSLDFDNTITLALGSEQLNQRMHRFLLLHRRVLLDEPRSVQYVDARYSSGVAVKYTTPPLLAASEVAASELVASEFSSNPLQERH